jgi:GT2 family glycosyltransferase
VSRPDDLTVVVVSHNRRDELLASLPRHEAPVILVDNGSSDQTATAVRAALPQVRVVELERNVGAAARTVGLRLASTPFVAFADDDSWWAPGALAAAAEMLRAHPRLAVLSARILVGEDERLDPICALMANSALGREPDLPGPSILGFIACAAAVRVQAFAEVGGFDDVVRFPGEEERVALDLEARGWAMAYVEELVVHHHPSPRRHSPAARQAAVTRSSVLTAVMRRPWASVRREVATALRAGSPGRKGVVTALPDLPAALRRRRPVPPSLEDRVRRLQAAANEPVARR